MQILFFISFPGFYIPLSIKSYTSWPDILIAFMLNKQHIK